MHFTEDTWCSVQSLFRRQSITIRLNCTLNWTQFSFNEWKKITFLQLNEYFNTAGCLLIISSLEKQSLWYCFETESSLYQNQSPTHRKLSSYIAHITVNQDPITTLLIITSKYKISVHLKHIFGPMFFLQCFE